MHFRHEPVSRRTLLASGAIAASHLALGRIACSQDKPAASSAGKAQIAITLDLEMSRNFPTHEEMRWDYEKGNLNDESKRYTVEACRRVKAAGGVLHCFAVGRVFEQENVDWLKGIVAQGHPLGNHTYDHVNVTATKPADIQFRFQRAPWLLGGREPAEVIRDNIHLCTIAMRSRLGIEPAGFRTPGGFATGLKDRPDVQQIILGEGFRWVSSLYPPHPYGEPQAEPTAEVYDGIVERQAGCQPFVYPTGLIEVPMNPISDIGAFRTGRWKVEWFMEAVRRGVNWAIEHRAAYDFLAHPSCLYVTDPQFRTIDMICDLVRKAGDQAELVSVDALAKRAQG
jgi:peptidoglycan/xylan/chitin deacetylase (PgdA/CDA1 family)